MLAMIDGTAFWRKQFLFDLKISIKAPLPILVSSKLDKMCPLCKILLQLSELFLSEFFLIVAQLMSQCPV